MKSIRSIFILLVIPVFSYAQTPTVEVLTSGTKTSIRGLSVVNDMVVWASGSKGTIGKSTDGGKTWNEIKPVISP